MVEKIIYEIATYVVKSEKNIAPGIQRDSLICLAVLSTPVQRCDCWLSLIAPSFNTLSRSSQEIVRDMIRTSWYQSHQAITLLCEKRNIKWMLDEQQAVLILLHTFSPL